jgi:hypothetical protein
MSSCAKPNPIPVNKAGTAPLQWILPMRALLLNRSLRPLAAVIAPRPVLPPASPGLRAAGSKIPVEVRRSLPAVVVNLPVSHGPLSRHSSPLSATFSCSMRPESEWVLCCSQRARIRCQQWHWRRLRALLQDNPNLRPKHALFHGTVREQHRSQG